MTKILITEDSSFQRRNIRAMLNNAGYETEEAENGKKALLKLERDIPDGILVDLLMPEMNGFDLLSVLREKYPDIPTIVVTSDIQETTYQQCLDLGAKAIINKPVNKEKLIASLKQLIV